MRIHEDWASAGFGEPPVAPETSVFPRREYPERWGHHFGGGALHLVEDGSDRKSGG